MNFSRIVSTGSYLPPQIISNDRLAEIVETNDEWIVSRTGIGNRRFSQGENTSDVASKAAKVILARAGKSAEDVELLIVATVSPDYATPSTACLVQAKIGAENAVAFDIGAACSGFIFAFSIADKFIKSGVYKNALVIGVEVLSKYLDFQDRGTCVLFGDGGAGVFLEKSEERIGLIRENLGSDGSKGMALTSGFVPVKNAFYEPEDTGNRYIEMDGRVIFDFATRKAPKSVLKILEEAELTADDIDWVVAHQANSRIIEVVSRKLKIPMDKFYMNMHDYGNTSAGSIPIALNEMMEKGLIKKGHKVILCGFGAGLTWGSMLLEF